MSEETNETNKVIATDTDYEKARTKFHSEEYSKDEFLTLAQMYTDSFHDVKEGELIKGTIVGVQDDYVIVDVGFKSEGTIPIIEFPEDSELKIGDKIEVVLESLEDNYGNLILSKQRADFLKIWSRVMSAHETGEIIEGKIIKRIKGGMVVDLFGMEAFLPGSQIDVRPIRDFDAFVGQTMDFKVVKVNVPTENVVVSHKALVEEEIAVLTLAVLTV
jgi:small subunit ribosomal protein S1